ncbi:hypothetical protein DL764_004879 [Monosporascus ibericus]|uniref:Uncharacterized protein n=1 Tax=Monosporascus ibericus TaxID=155417 RepID=A0A4V1XAT1_9PEZI|nr:hypothetical protein DL764_004879 [Monosporascus ibericus]
MSGSYNDDEPDPFTTGGDWGIDPNDYYEQTTYSSSYGSGTRMPLTDDTSGSAWNTEPALFDPLAVSAGSYAPTDLEQGASDAMLQQPPAKIFEEEDMPSLDDRMPESDGKFHCEEQQCEKKYSQKSDLRYGNDKSSCGRFH